VRSGTVLIVDDTQGSIVALELACGSIPGITVHSVRSAFDAVKLLESDRPVRAMITDIHMPGMDGFELIRFLRHDARYGATPIIVISADTDPDTPDRAARLGADAYFSKPFSPAAVRRTLERLLDAHQDT
jgi:two-component system, chemotaxis family, chemotaxis protein CheY